jgi:hypothetical protein
MKLADVWPCFVLPWHKLWPGAAIHDGPDSGVYVACGWCGRWWNVETGERCTKPTTKADE